MHKDKFVTKWVAGINARMADMCEDSFIIPMIALFYNDAASVGILESKRKMQRDLGAITQRSQNLARVPWYSFGERLRAHVTLWQDRMAVRIGVWRHQLSDDAINRCIGSPEFEFLKYLHKLTERIATWHAFPDKFLPSDKLPKEFLDVKGPLDAPQAVYHHLYRIEEAVDALVPIELQRTMCAVMLSKFMTQREQLASAETGYVSMRNFSVFQFFVPCYIFVDMRCRYVDRLYDALQEFGSRLSDIIAIHRQLLAAQRAQVKPKWWARMLPRFIRRFTPEFSGALSFMTTLDENQVIQLTSEALGGMLPAHRDFQERHPSHIARAKRFERNGARQPRRNRTSDIESTVSTNPLKVLSASRGRTFASEKLNATVEANQPHVSLLADTLELSPRHDEPGTNLEEVVISQQNGSRQPTEKHIDDDVRTPAPTKTQRKASPSPGRAITSEHLKTSVVESQAHSAIKSSTHSKAQYGDLEEVVVDAARFHTKLFGENQNAFGHDNASSTNLTVLDREMLGSHVRSASSAQPLQHVSIELQEVVISQQNGLQPSEKHIDDDSSIPAPVKHRAVRFGEKQIAFDHEVMGTPRILNSARLKSIADLKGTTGEVATRAEHVGALSETHAHKNVVLAPRPLKPDLKYTLRPSDDEFNEGASRSSTSGSNIETNQTSIIRLHLSHQAQKRTTSTVSHHKEHASNIEALNTEISKKNHENEANPGSTMILNPIKNLPEDDLSDPPPQFDADDLKLAKRREEKAAARAAQRQESLSSAAASGSTRADAQPHRGSRPADDLSDPPPQFDADDLKLAKRREEKAAARAAQKESFRVSSFFSSGF